MIFLLTLHTLAGLIAVAESLNKLERVDFKLRPTLVENSKLLLKTLAWLGICVGGGCAVISPLINMATSRWQDMILLLGVACLIVNTRLKELD